VTQPEDRSRGWGCPRRQVAWFERRGVHGLFGLASEEEPVAGRHGSAGPVRPPGADVVLQQAGEGLGDRGGRLAEPEKDLIAFGEDIVDGEPDS
jgi:hypothetical protein